jgi:hypothetical protein
VRTSNRIVGSHIAVGSTKHRARQERAFARVGMDIRIAFITACCFELIRIELCITGYTTASVK